MAGGRLTASTPGGFGAASDANDRDPVRISAARTVPFCSINSPQTHDSGDS